MAVGTVGGGDYRVDRGGGAEGVEMVPGFVCQELTLKGGGGLGGFHKGPLFPDPKFWVKIFLGVGGSQTQKTSPHPL